MRFFSRPTDGRFYVILPASRDLLGDLVVVTRRGSEGSRRGGVKSYYCRDDNDLERTERRLAKIRLRHGYLEVGG